MTTQPGAWRCAITGPPPINDDDVLPESDSVLAYDPRHGQVIAGLVELGGDEPETVWIIEGPDGYRCNPTHWQPLPADPPGTSN